MSIKCTKTNVKLHAKRKVVGSETEELKEQDAPSVTSTSAELIQEIQRELRTAAAELQEVRMRQERAVEAVLEGNFTEAVNIARGAGEHLRIAKQLERRASIFLTQLIPAMRAEGFAEAIIFGVVETLIAEFLGA